MLFSSYTILEWNVTYTIDIEPYVILRKAIIKCTTKI